MKRKNFIQSLSVGLLMSMTKPLFAGPGKRMKINGTGKNATINEPGKGATVILNEPEPVQPTLDAPILTASAITSTQINLSWTASEGATNYLLERSLDGVAWSTLYSGTSLSYNNVGLTAGTTYYYRVSAQADGYTAGVSSIANDTTPPADVDNPVILRTNTSADGTKIFIQFDREMDPVTGMHTQFAWKQNSTSRTITAATIVNSKTIQLTTSHTIAKGDEVLISYTPGTVQSAESGAMRALVDLWVLNCRTTNDIPFFEDWDVIVDGRVAGNFTLSGTNITKILDEAATGRFWLPQSTAYATYDAANECINVLAGTNSYTTEREVRRPADGKFAFAFLFKAPNSGDTNATQPIEFMQHVPKGDIITLAWDATISRRNIQLFAGKYWAVNVAQSTLTNNGGWHRVVGTFDGTTLKVWSNGNYVARAPIMNSHVMFNRLLSRTTKAVHDAGQMWLGKYRSDAEVATIDTFLNGLIP